MFSRHQTKSNLSNIINNIPKDELFDSIENKNEDKIIEFINAPELKVWQIKDENNNTILHKSCFDDYIDITIIIIKELKKRLGSSSLLTNFINEKNDEGLTALHFTAFNGNIELSKILIKNGASTEILTNLGKNIIHLSAEGNQPSSMIYFLFKQKFDIYTRDENGSTPLHWACYSGAEDSVNYLIGLNADIDAQDKEKLTPLHLATLYNREKIVIKLLQNGADKNLKNSRGEKPIDIAIKKNLISIVNILKDKDYNPLCSLDPPLMYINPNDIYKKFILVMIIIPEIIIIFMILPYLENIINIIINNILFLIELFLFIILIFIDPGYKKNDNYINEQFSSIYEINNDFPLLNLIEKKIDIKHHCPKCYIPESYNYIHCIICDKCIEGFSHHCFWLNKCIGKKNIFFYYLFIAFSLFFSYHIIFICFYSLFDFVSIPYEKLFYFSIFQLGKDRELRVLFTALVIIFSSIISFPLVFLFCIEIIKFFDKNKIFSKNKRSDINEDVLELEIKKNRKNNNIILEDKSKKGNNNYDFKNNDFLGINRITNINANEKEILLNNTNNNIPLPETPFSVEKKELTDYDDE